MPLFHAQDVVEAQLLFSPLNQKTVGIEPVSYTHLDVYKRQRLLSSMCARQYVEKRSDNTYAIGYKLVETVSTHINGLELLTESKPFLSQISHELELTTHLGILDHHDVIYIEKMDLYPNTRLYTCLLYTSRCV